MVKLVSLSIVRSRSQSLESFKEELLNGITNLPSETDFCVLPEYCWGMTEFNQVLTIIEDVKSLQLPICFVMGSIAIKTDESGIHNQAIILFPNGELYFVPKTNVLSGEANRQGVKSGQNNQTFSYNGIRFGVLICADLWNYNILEKLILEQKAELLLVPALTVVPPGLSAYAKIQWYSLGIARSREFIIPMVISDHSENNEDYDVGNASCIIDPSLKSSEMQKIEDFLMLSTSNMVSYELDLNKVQEYRNYRIQNGLFRI